MAVRPVEQAAVLLLQVPEFFQDPEFLAWLGGGYPKCTSYRGGMPAADEEVLVLVDPGLEGEGSASAMPQWCWDHVLSACRETLAPRAGAHHVRVQLYNRV